MGPFRLPLLPVLFAYMAGIYVGHFDLAVPLETFVLALFILLAAWALCLTLKRTILGSCIVFPLFFILGIFSIQLYLRPPSASSSVSRFNGFDRIAVEGIVERSPDVSQEGTRLLIQSEKVILPDRHVPVDGHLLLFLKDEYGPFRVGDRLRFLCRLHAPRGFRNPGGFSYARHLALERIQTIGFLSGERMWAQTGEGLQYRYLLWIEGWRDRIRQFLETEAHPPCSGIFEALVLGEQGNIPEEVRDCFTRTGVAHLLAISGDQFGIVAFLCFSLILWSLKRSELLLLSISVRKWAAGLTIPCLFVYALIAGGSISVIRAMIMVTVFFISILFDRERNLLHSLALAAFVLLLFSPPSLFDVSFQLSFMAVLSILYLIPRILQALKPEEMLPPPKRSRIENVWKYAKLSFLVTVVATLGTSPFVMLHFNRISPIGLVTNLFAIPWVGFFIVPLSLLASIASFFVPPLATFLIQVNGFLTLIFLKVLAFFASIPYASLFVSTPTVLEMVLFYLLLFTLVHLRSRRRMRYLFVGVCLAFVLDITFWSIENRFHKNLTMTFLDVGHGDSILIEFPRGKRMLVDGGGLYNDRFDTGKNVIAPFLWSRKIGRIDYLVLTHPDPDHLKGLVFVASHFSIGQFWESGFSIDSEPYGQLKQILSSKGVPELSLSDQAPSERINGVQISILNPGTENELSRSKKHPFFLNNQSLVMKVQFKKISVLLAADIGEQGEYRMMRQGHSLRADLLKIPHHGSSSSSSLLFLQRINPSYAVLSVGERSIGRLPNPEVLKRYQALGTKIYRTDRHGAITMVTDGEKIEIRPFLEGEP